MKSLALLLLEYFARTPCRVSSPEVFSLTCRLCGCGIALLG
ncbi:MAG: hypothetical protein RMJ00_00330 [Nitrososphaerota archaeon]|nr:hypothetical protein [Nitrososphaerota archaeon]